MLLELPLRGGNHYASTPRDSCRGPSSAFVGQNRAGLVQPDITHPNAEGQLGEQPAIAHQVAFPWLATAAAACFTVSGSPR